MTKSQTRALIIGGSISGLLTARVLSDHFDQVIILERDTFPADPTFRSGVPQAKHIHLLLVRGRLILERLFPGLEAEITDAGAPVIDFSADARWFSARGWALRFPTGITTYSCTRLLLEWSIRQRVLAIPNVEVRQQRDVTALLLSVDKTTVIGVEARPRGQESQQQVEQIYADLVVDASGRNSKTPDWLKAIGYPAPETTSVKSGLGYTSRWFEVPPTSRDWKAIVIQSRPPEHTRTGFLLPAEGNRWVASVVGPVQDQAPIDDNTFFELAHSLQSDILYQAVKDARPISETYRFQNTENRIYHYEALNHWPEHFLVTGDAVCAFNPVYGQGMSVSAMDAEILDHLLQKRKGSTLAGLGRGYQKAIAKSNKTPWLMATSEDFKYATTVGAKGTKRSVLTSFSHWYLGEVLSLAAQRKEVFIAFLEVMQLLKPPTRLFAPGIVVQVFYRALRRKRERQPDTEPAQAAL